MAISDPRQGDIFLFSQLDGGEISIKNGEPVMDQGFESAVYLSLGGSISDWWGNEYLDDNEKIISLSGAFAQDNELTSASLLTYEELVLKDLEWFINTKIADTINVTAVAVSRNKTEVSIEIIAAGDTKIINPFLVNWNQQRDYAASERV
jgi:phage gp46-like protein